MTKDFKKFLTESELKLEPNMRVGDTLRLNINAKQIVEMTITDIGDGKITVESEQYRPPAELAKLLNKNGFHYSGDKGKHGPNFSNKDYGSYDLFNDDWINNVTGKSGKGFNSLENDLRNNLDLDESSRPDFLDFDKDGDEEETMNKALDDKEDDVEEGRISGKFSTLKHDPNREWTHAKTGMKGKVLRPSTEMGGRDGVDIKWENGKTETLPRDHFSVNHNMSGTRYVVLDKSPWKVDESMSPQQKFDFQRVTYGAMKKADYDKKWAKPVDGTKKLDPTGAYKNLIKKPVKEGTVYPNATVIKTKDGTPIGEVYQEEHGWGCFHYKADRGYDILDDKKQALEYLKQLHKETKKVKESSHDDAGLQDIVSSLSNDVAEFYSGAEMSGDLYEKLYDYYSQEMPYGTQKARDGDPMNWISDRFLQDLEGMNYGAGDSKLDEILKLSGVKPITREAPDVSEPVAESRGNLFATILKNAGLKAVTESDLNTNEGIFKGIKRAFRGWPEPKGINGEANKPKDIVARVRSSDDDFLNAVTKRDVTAHSPAGLQKAAAQQELKRRANKQAAEKDQIANIDSDDGQEHTKYRYPGPGYLDKYKKYRTESHSFEMNEGKIVVDNQLFDLTLNNARRTWTANIWTSKKVF